MRKRKEILNDLIKANGDIDQLEAELKQFPWDIDTPLVNLTTQDVMSVINKVKQGEMDLATLNAWADVIECREDIEFVNKEEEVLLMIHRLASPYLYGTGGLDIEENMKKVVKDLLSKEPKPPRYWA